MGLMMTMPRLDGTNVALLVLASLVVMAIGLVVTALIVIRLPVDYLVRAPGSVIFQGNRALGWIILIGKNLGGLAVVGIGLVMSIPGVPGPGLLVILVGIMILDFPGKHRLERLLLGLPRVLAAVNRLRVRHGHAPLEAPARKDPAAHP